MEFKYKAKVDKKWLKGRSLTDKKEDATEFETESEPTQIINKLKRDGKVPQKAIIKIVKRRESTNLNYETIYRESSIKMKVDEGLFTPKSWSAKGIEKSKKAEDIPLKYSVHIKNLDAEQLFGLFAMNNLTNDVELFGFGLVKIKGRFYLYDWQPDECNWSHPKMGMNKLAKPSSEISAYLLSEDFTDEMADDLSHWIVSKEPWGISSGRTWPIFAEAATSSSAAKCEGIIVFGNSKASVNKYKKVYNSLINGRNALPIEDENYVFDISEISNKFQNGSWLQVDLSPKEIMSLDISQRDIYDGTSKKNYGEFHESKNKGVNMNFSKIYREAKKFYESVDDIEAFKKVFQKYFNKNSEYYDINFDSYFRLGEYFDSYEAGFNALICPKGFDLIYFRLPEIIKEEFPWYDANAQRIELNSISPEEFDKLIGALCYAAQKIEDEGVITHETLNGNPWAACDKSAIPQYSEAGERIYDTVLELSQLPKEEKGALYRDWNQKYYAKPKSKKPSKGSVTKEEVFKKVYENDDMIEVDVNDYDKYDALNEITCYLQDAAWSEFQGYKRKDFEDEFPEWFMAHSDFMEYADYESLSYNYGLEEYKGVNPLDRF